MPIPTEIADTLRALGTGFNLPQVQALYAPLLAAQPRDGAECLADQAYGPHARHRCDIYRPTSAEAAAPGATGGPSPAAACPVLVWLHGGGFIRGDKAARANIGWWGARQGFVTVVPNYRLAPESRWPSGPQDVVALWCWLQQTVAAQGGDPRAIVLAGESAGAAHVAAAVLMRRFQPAHWAPAGAVLCSGPYDARLEGLAREAFGIETPDPRNEAYFGPEPADWDAASIVDHVDAAPLPLWISWAERDLLQMQVQGAALYARLVSRHGWQPRLRWVAEHNHYSGGFSIGTDDDSVSAPLADFVRACAARRR